MLLIFPLPERGIASLGQTVNNEKGACECERISIGCSERSVDKTQCHIEQRESSRGVKKRGRGGSCCKINFFISRPDPNPILFFITPLLSCPWLFRSVLLTRTIGTGQNIHRLMTDIWFLSQMPSKMCMVRTKKWHTRRCQVSLMNTW